MKFPILCVQTFNSHDQNDQRVKLGGGGKEIQIMDITDLYNYNLLKDL